jgi:hypothetical protein
MTVNLNSHSQHRVADCTLERTQTPSVEADDYSSRTSEAMTASDVSSVKRKRDEPSEFYDADNKDSTFSRKKLNSSKSESDMEVSSEKLCFSSVKYLREKVYENEDFLKSKKKRKSGRNRHKRESVNSEKFTYRATSPGALDLEREVIADVEEVKLNQAVGSILTSSAEVVSQQFSMNLEMSSPEQVVSSHPSETTKSLSELSETDDSLHSVVKGALEDLQEDMVSLYYDRFGIRCKSSIDCRAVELTSPQHGLKSLSHIPLMMHRSTAINETHSNVRFPCFDDNCASNVTDKLTTESRKADEAWNISRIKSNARSRKCVEKGEKQFDGRTVIDQPEKIKEKLTAGVKYTIHSGLTVDLESPLSPPAAQKVSKDVDSGPLNAASVIPIQSNHEMIPSDNSLQLTVQQSRTLNQSHLINYEVSKKRWVIHAV